MQCLIKDYDPHMHCAFQACNKQCPTCRDYQAGKTKPAYPVPAIYNDHILRPLVRGYWALYWYRMGYVRSTSTFTCSAARYTTHCEAFGYKPCNVCADYELGLYEPHYPVPAVIYHVEYTVFAVCIDNDSAGTYDEYVGFYVD